MYSTSLFPFVYALHNNSFMWITTAILIICTGLFCSNEVISQLLGTKHHNTKQNSTKFSSLPFQLFLKNNTNPAKAIGTPNCMKWVSNSETSTYI